MGIGPKEVIMLIDDSDDDLYLLRKALAKIKLTTRVIEMRDGVEAVRYLQGEGEYSDRSAHPLPCLIISDLKMPMMNGLEFLQWLDCHHEFHHIPVVMLSASGHAEDRRRAAELGCCAYFEKPIGFSQLADLAEHLDKTWIETHCRSRVA